MSLEMFERDVQPVARRLPVGPHSRRRNAQDLAPLAAVRDRLPSARRGGEGSAAGQSLPRTCRVVSPQRSRSPARRRSAQLSETPTVRYVARDLECPRDAYFDRFAATMSGHPGATQTADEKQAMTERYYWAQCVKDETMAESIVAALDKSAAPAAPKPEATAAPSSTTTVHSTATSVWAPPNASAAALPGKRHRRDLDAARRRSRHAGARRRRPQTR